MAGWTSTYFPVKQKVPDSVENTQFFPEVHHKISCSWGKLYTSRVYNAVMSDYSDIVENKQYGYFAKPKVEGVLVSEIRGAGFQAV